MIFPVHPHDQTVLVDGDEGDQLSSLGAHKGCLEQVLGASSHHPDLQPFQGVEPGSLEAKKALSGWEKGIKLQGSYLGKPLQPGIHPGDGDFDLLRFKIYMRTGDWDMGGRVAAGVQKKLYGV